MKRKATYERDNLVVNLMITARGEENALSAKSIAEYLTKNGYKTQTKYIGTLINNIMYERKIPICYINAKGYYWAKSKLEIKKTISDLESRISALKDHIAHLEIFMID